MPLSSTLEKRAAVASLRSAPVKKTRYVAALDGLRALAVGSVMFAHAGYPLIRELGWLGVDLFFVLSGFLITSLLIEERRATGGIDLARFWGRRLLRLMPTYWLYILGLSLLMAFGGGWTREVGGWTPGAYLRSLWFYYSNYAPLGVWEYQPLGVHLWSLAVEEQFYVLWPIFMTFIPGGAAATTAAWLIFGAMVSRNLFLSPFPEYSLDTRGVSIVLGCAVALSLAHWPRLGARLRRRGVVEGAALGCFALGVIVSGAKANHLFGMGGVFRLFLPIFSVGFAVLAASIWEGATGPVVRFLSWPPLVYLGRISYGIYLYHLLALHLMAHIPREFHASHPYLSDFVGFLVFTTTTLALAVLSYRLIETRFLRLKAHLKPRTVDRGEDFHPPRPQGGFLSEGRLVQG
ncbi:acyltransferase family protein [Paludisphaera rhizosphaerae]|uniref:acyltransferase family protein n=1 Tax=Paludisphaera rhizosphaerae TaxID=2711216 RepID=UPI0013EB2DEC|nr:acyltransferase [Paludisphaera rhizosphaerae]